MHPAIARTVAKEQLEADAVVVGGGLSGLVAARTLRRGGCSVVVLEASSRLGGRLMSHEFPDGSQADLGGQWFGPGQNRLLALAAELALPAHLTATRGKTAYEFNDKRGRYSGSAPRLNPIVLLSVAIGFWRLSLAVNRFKKRPPWGTPEAARLDQQSVAHWIQTHVWTVDARRFVRLSLEGILCAELENVSWLVLLHSVAASGSLEHMFAVQGGAQERQFTDGAYSLVAGVADEVKGCIHLDHPVTHIHHRLDGATVSGASFEVRTKHVVIAVPGPLVAKVKFEPDLEAPTRGLFEHMAMGAVVKCVVQYSRPFWRDAALSGAMWSANGPIDLAYDTSPSGASRGCLSVLATASRADHLRSLSAEARRAAVLDALVRHFGERAKDCLDYADKIWADEPWIGGGYAAHVPPGRFNAGLSALQGSHGVLHWAGTETASEWPGYMEGAIEAGQRAAGEILKARGQDAGITSANA